MRKLLFSSAVVIALATAAAALGLAEVSDMALLNRIRGAADWLPSAVLGQAPSGSLLPAGYLHTSGSQIVDANGNPVRLNSIGWDGSDNDGFVPNGLYAVNYQTTMQQMVKSGFNAIRLPWTNALLHGGMPYSGGIDYNLNPDLKGLSGLQVLDKVVTYAGQIGLKVVLDHHTDDGSGGQQPNGLWYDVGGASDGTDGAGHTGTVTQQSFVTDWVTMAQRYANNPTVIGFDLDNEPAHSTWAGPVNTSIQQMATATGNAIQAVNPNALIIVEAPQTYPGGPEGDFSQVAANPVTLTDPNHVVYSPHEYGPEIDPGIFDGKPSDYIAQMNNAWGYLATRNIAPVWIGEMGTDGATSAEISWIQTLTGYVNGQDGAQGGPTLSGNQQGVGTNWWAWGPENGGHGHPDGFLLNWSGNTPRPDQQAMVNQLAPLAMSGRNPPRAVTSAPAPTPMPAPMPATNPPSPAPIATAPGGSLPEPALSQAYPSPMQRHRANHNGDERHHQRGGRGNLHSAISGKSA